MELKSIKAFCGRNVHSHYPVIEMTVDLGPYGTRKTSELPNFASALPACLPGLAAHTCSRGTPGGFLERVQEGTLLGHVIEHVALELQEVAGIPMAYGKTRRAERPGVYRIIFEYRARDAALAAGRAALVLVKDLLEGRHPDGKALGAEIARIAARTELGPSTASIARAAQARGIPVTRIGAESLIQLGHGRYRRFVRATVTDRTSCLGVDLAGDKAMTRQILGEAGLPVPYGLVASTAQEAVASAEEVGYPVVVKPRHGNQGRGVSVDLRNEGEVRCAFELACLHDGEGEVVVERFICGCNYRFLVIDGRVAAVAEKCLPAVTGDGRATIVELVERTNQDPLRGEGHEKPLTRIRIGPEALLALSKQGYTPGAVPEKDSVVYLREGANLSSGGTAHDVTPLAHPANLEVAVRAAGLLGLDVAGVDVVAQDVAHPLEESGGAIIEVNAAPGLRMHLYPSRGDPRPVGEAFVDYLFPPGSPSRIPICAITGTNGKTTVARMIAFGLQRTGKCVGMATTGGIFVGGRRVARGDTTGPLSARAVLADPAVEVAVLETARGGIIRGGLGFDWCDVAVVTNIARDHVGTDGIRDLDDLVHLKALVVEAVPRRGRAVLNADDARVLSMADRCHGEVLLFSARSDNLTVRRHLREGGRAISVSRGMITLAGPDGDFTIARARRMPVALDGRAPHNVANALAAAGALYGLGLAAADIGAALLEFGGQACVNQGRAEMRLVAGRRVLLDYGHNVPALRALLRVVKGFDARRVVGVIAAPGNRPSADIREFGALAASGFGRLIIKEDEDRRGREAGETAALLWKGARAAGLPADGVTVILNEEDAVRAALDMTGPGDLVVVLYEEYDRIERLLAQIEAQWQGGAGSERAARPQGSSHLPAKSHQRAAPYASP
jgi:cyanophycin synthetase